ncbi:MAG: RDD family protein [Nitrospirae bacterium]|nr:RDD family protein [Nitrospirota bacterium]
MNVKANLLNRVIAKGIDFIIVGALAEIIPKIGYFAGMVYLLISDGLFEGRSVGKRIIGLKVILQETMQACTFRESVIRNFLFAVGYVLIAVPLIGFIFPVIILIFESLLMIGNEKGMRFGDEIAKTQVIEEKGG